MLAQDNLLRGLQYNNEKKSAFLLFVFVSQSVFADMTCDISFSKYYAIYEPNSYTCSSGQYLPANTLGCVSCPSGFSCNGGTFDFNANFYQGAILNTITTNTMNNICSANFPTKLYLIYEPNQHNCSAGYYLPANVDECRPCLKDNKCTGGTYTFNETNDQGIEPCTGNTLHASAGSAVCYPHVLHLSSERPNDVIYLKSVATTSPAFNIDLNDDGVSDAFANMTTTKTRMTNASEHYLKLMVNGVLYYVCDDTSCP